MDYILENDIIKIKVNSHGAELVSIIKKDTNEEYLWQKKRYWKRSSPVLFPFVGNVTENFYSVDGKKYAMGQHGFARDMDFTLLAKLPDEVWLGLDWDSETLEKYPYKFNLKIGYKISGSEVMCMWRVSTESEEMHFMIGAHPAFNCPPRKVEDPVLNSEEEIINHDRTGCFIDYHTNHPIKYNLCDGKYLGFFDLDMECENGCMRIDEHSFDRDALIIENNQTHEVSLMTKEKEPFVTVKFEEPLVGIWSPVGESVPFVCIEPWFGRTDRVGFNGDISQREYEQNVKRGEEFCSTYTIIIE